MSAEARNLLEYYVHDLDDPIIGIKYLLANNQKKVVEVEDLKRLILQN